MVHKYPIKSRALPLCDCEPARDRFLKKTALGNPLKENFQDCFKRPSSQVPTQLAPTSTDYCKYCDSFVYWEAGYSCFCKCPEVHAHWKGQSVNYSSNLKNRSKLLPSNPKKHNPFLCGFCGQRLIWRNAEE